MIFIPNPGGAFGLSSDGLRRLLSVDFVIPLIPHIPGYIHEFEGKLFGPTFDIQDRLGSVDPMVFLM